MNYGRAHNAYRQAAVQAEIHPVKLIHMMYDGILTFLDHAIIGMEQNDPRKRGENIGKAIGLISELNASIKGDDHSESAMFLHGLYESILVELPKASIRNDMQIVGQTRKYIEELKKIWEKTAMHEHGFELYLHKKEAESSLPGGREYQGLSPAEATMARGVSFSI
ncbi:MAG: flagellar export chaperone FliS [Desulfobacteraceae bacterium]|nr:flagellar export chaperone FliS [Desulfobacteraceae bacterium]